jgi:hypothetical protein
LIPGPATGLPVVVTAGHSAFLALGPPVHWMGPTTVLVTADVQLDTVPWSELSM